MVMSERKASRRAPSLYALALVVVLTASGVLLRWWGPINPSIGFGMTYDHGSIGGYGSGSFQPVWHVDGTAPLTLNLANRSHSPVTVERLRTVRLPGSLDLPLPSVHMRAGSTHLASRGSLGLDVTLVAAKGCETWSANRPDDGRINLASSFSIVADLRTSSGRIKTVGRNLQLNDICPTSGFLPTAGAQPKVPAAAKHAVTVAFWTAYDSRSSLEAKATSIDDVSGIPTGLPGGTRSQVHDIVFTSATSAAVVYDIYLDGSPVVTDQLGHARLVDGTWRVTRETICTDVGLANKHCT